MKKILNVKRLSCLALAAIIVVCTTLTAFGEESKPTLQLPATHLNLNAHPGAMTPFKPEHKYGSMQNPPDFTWTQINGAESYDIVVARDEQLTDIAYREDGLKWHYYNFPYTFEPGTYWWAVRYHIGNKVSDWGVARRFRIDPDATEFIVPDADNIKNMIPKSHPRLWFTEETKDEFLKKAQTKYGAQALEYIISGADSTIKTKYPEDPGLGRTYDDEEESRAAVDNASTLGQKVAADAVNTAMAYVFTGDKKYFDYSVGLMMHVSDWDYVEGWTSYKWQDQPFFIILSHFSFAYDWLYNDMTEEQRNKIGGMLKGRFDIVKDSSLNIIRNSPYESHIWAYMSNYAIGAIALMHDYPEIENYFVEFMQLFVPTYVPMSNEDGGWSKGTQYWKFSYNRDSMLAKVLTQNGYMDLYSKPWHQNQYLWALYMFPHNSYGSFGDSANTAFVNNDIRVIQGLADDAYFTGNPVTAWLRDKVGSFALWGSTYDSILSSDGYDIEPTPPKSYPRAWTFIDQGTTAMHSDIVSTNRTSLYFRASKYGSYNHLMADQNNYVIESNGERLIARSGYYDAYHSTHDSGFTRQTYANNSVTYDMGLGQTDDSMTANGNTDMFVTSQDFDAVVGDATNAYDGGLDKFVRSIVYIRPDKYIIIDSLKAQNSAIGNKANFEWWQNTKGDNSIYIHDDKRGINITASKMAADTRMHYPEKLTPYYSNIFSGPELVNIPPMGEFASRPVDKRIWFETESVSQTKIIATINVHGADEPYKYVNETKYDDYISLEFDDGTVALVSTVMDDEKVINAGDISFVGTAVVYNEDTIMLVGGKLLTMYGIKLIESEDTVSVVCGEGQLGVSSKDDYKLTLYTGNELISEITSVKEFMDSASPVSAELTGIGVTYGENGEVYVDAQKGHYSLLVNEAVRHGYDSGKNISIDVVIDGVTKTVSAPAYYNADYELAAIAEVEIPMGNYLLVGNADKISLGEKGKLSKTVATSLGGNHEITFVGENRRVELKSVPTYVCDVTAEPDWNALNTRLSAKVEAEDFKEKVGVARLTNGLDFLTGITQLNSTNDSITYEIEVPEDGVYDIAFRYGVWMDPLPKRMIEMNNAVYVFTLPQTGGWGGNGPDDFKGAVIDTNMVLTAGKHTFTIKVFENGSYWNYDWIGLVKSE